MFIIYVQLFLISRKIYLHAIWHPLSVTEAKSWMWTTLYVVEFFVWATLRCDVCNVRAYFFCWVWMLHCFIRNCMNLFFAHFSYNRYTTVSSLLCVAVLENEPSYTLYGNSYENHDNTNITLDYQGCTNRWYGIFSHLTFNDVWELKLWQN